MRKGTCKFILTMCTNLCNHNDDGMQYYPTELRVDYKFVSCGPLLRFRWNLHMRSYKHTEMKRQVTSGFVHTMIRFHINSIYSECISAGWALLSRFGALAFYVLLDFLGWPRGGPVVISALNNIDTRIHYLYVEQDTYMWMQK